MDFTLLMKIFGIVLYLIIGFGFSAVLFASVDENDLRKNGLMKIKRSGNIEISKSFYLAVISIGLVWWAFLIFFGISALITLIRQKIGGKFGQ
jgi:hypothetical protein